MTQVPSIMSLHLRYRLWIAEMNLDINVLRIFDDYLKELESRIDKPELKTRMDYFEKVFVSLRNVIDDLRHEMHLLKMKLAAYSRAKNPVDSKKYHTDNHTGIKKGYAAFRKTFDKVKNEFSDFEGKWLD